MADESTTGLETGAQQGQKTQQQIDDEARQDEEARKRQDPANDPRLQAMEAIAQANNQRIDNVKFAMNKRYFVKRGAQVDLRSLTRNVPGSATLVNDIEKDVKVVDTQDVTGSAFQEQDRLNLDFDEARQG